MVYILQYHGLVAADVMNKVADDLFFSIYIQSEEKLRRLVRPLNKPLFLFFHNIKPSCQRS